MANNMIGTATGNSAGLGGMLGLLGIGGGLLESGYNMLQASKTKDDIRKWENESLTRQRQNIERTSYQSPNANYNAAMSNVQAGMRHAGNYAANRAGSQGAGNGDVFSPVIAGAMSAASTGAAMAPYASHMGQLAMQRGQEQQQQNQQLAQQTHQIGQDAYDWTTRTQNPTANFMNSALAGANVMSNISQLFSSSANKDTDDGSSNIQGSPGTGVPLQSAQNPPTSTSMTSNLDQTLADIHNLLPPKDEEDTDSDIVPLLPPGSPPNTNTPGQPGATFIPISQINNTVVPDKTNNIIKGAVNMVGFPNQGKATSLNPLQASLQNQNMINPYKYGTRVLQPNSY